MRARRLLKSFSGGQQSVIPAKAGIQNIIGDLGPGLRRGDVTKRFCAVAFFVSFAVLPVLAAPTFQKVMVHPGDTLWSIAQTYLKDPEKWSEILKYNSLPSQDPTIALPGMVLRVPVALIKESLQAAYLIKEINTVYFRRHETAGWKTASLNLDLYQGDSLRTLDASSARVKFLNGGLLSMDANSMAIIQPPKADYDVNLERGSVFVGRARVVTASARIEPKTTDTQYMAKVADDLSTVVEVYRGKAAVSAQGQTVDVKASMASVVPNGLAPQLPQKIADMSALADQASALTGNLERTTQAPKAASVPSAFVPENAAAMDVATGIPKDLASLEIGIPISGYRVQASASPSFDRLAFNKVFDSDAKFDPAVANLPPGVYWWRIALIDLLGTQEDFSQPKQYAVGAGEAISSFDPSDSVILIHPQEGETVFAADYRLSGRLKSGQATILVNGLAARQDEDGNFFAALHLKPGDNSVVVTVRNSSGQSGSMTRIVRYSASNPQ